MSHRLSRMARLDVTLLHSSGSSFSPPTPPTLPSLGLLHHHSTYSTLASPTPPLLCLPYSVFHTVTVVDQFSPRSDNILYNTTAHPHCIAGRVSCCYTCYLSLLCKTEVLTPGRWLIGGLCGQKLRERFLLIWLGLPST